MVFILYIGKISVNPIQLALERLMLAQKGAYSEMSHQIGKNIEIRRG